MIYFWQNKSVLNCSLNEFYRSVSTSKQAFHQSLKRSKHQEQEIRLLIELVLQIRNNHPTMNCRMMYYMINPVFVGRDKFESICRECGFTVERHKNFQKTTDSSGVVRFKNLLQDLKISYIDQVWSSDITYFQIGEVFYYITFILDNYSRRILGHAVSGRLTTEQTTLPALKMALKTRNNVIKEGVIFHSDGGGQYYDDNFLLLTKKYKFQNSMCEYPWENGKAERINGVIKNNYLKYLVNNNLKQLVKNVDRVVQTYNQRKPHIMLDKKTPIEFEENIRKFEQENQSKMTESIDEKEQIFRASSPKKSEQNQSLILEIISE
jgi:putative transposase